MLNQLSHPDTSISFISVLIFIMSFLLLVLDFVCSSFSSSFRCKVRLFEIFVASFKIYLFILEGKREHRGLAKGEGERVLSRLHAEHRA